MKKIFKDFLKWSLVGVQAPGQDGFGDDFLIKKDKNPNTSGAFQIFGLNESSADMTPLVEKAKRGELGGLFIFGHDLAKLYGSETLKTVRQNVQTIIYEGSNDNPTAQVSDIVIPSAVYAEKEGTFTNFEGRVQRIRKALEPSGNSRATWQILLDIGALLNLPISFKNPEEIFNDLAKNDEVFKNLTYKKIGKLGAVWNKK